MHPGTVAVVTAPFQYGPYIIALLAAALGAGGWFIRLVLVSLNAHTVSLAVLVAETRPTLKLTAEVIDLKVASAELNEFRLNTERRLETIEETLTTLRTRR